jgi:hypothetical protein
MDWPARWVREQLGYECAIWRCSRRTHASQRRGPNNERLEFLGDAVLNLSIAEQLYRAFPRRPKGDLSRLRSRLVSSEPLAETAAQGLGRSERCCSWGPGSSRAVAFGANRFSPMRSRRSAGPCTSTAAWMRRSACRHALFARAHRERCRRRRSSRIPRPACRSTCSRAGLPLPALRAWCAPRARSTPRPSGCAAR